MHAGFGVSIAVTTGRVCSNRACYSPKHPQRSLQKKAAFIAMHPSIFPTAETVRVLANSVRVLFRVGEKREVVVSPWKTRHLRHPSGLPLGRKHSTIQPCMPRALSEEGVCLHAHCGRSLYITLPTASVGAITKDDSNRNLVTTELMKHDICPK